MKELLKKLVQEPEQFKKEDFETSLELILENKATPAQIGSLITLLKIHQKEKDPDWIATCAKVLQRHALSIENRQLLDGKIIADIVGTGGDGFDTFNASTTAGIVVAACDVGIAVAKHGNRSSSSKCGSADLLEAVGCALESVNASNVSKIIDEAGFAFLFAQNYHPAMKQLGRIRKELGFASIFNLMGPLLNPIQPQVMVVGVNSRDLGRIVADALKVLGVKRALVVHGSEGLDEISPETETFVWHLTASGEIEQDQVNPASFGCLPISVKDVQGGGPDVNAQILGDFLDGKLSADHPISQFVCMNAAALLYACDKVTTLAEGMKLARNSVSSGRAKAVFQTYKRLTNEVK